MKKALTTPTKTQESLLRLRDELIECGVMDTAERELLFKINSCLYSTYPHHENNDYLERVNSEDDGNIVTIEDGKLRVQTY